MGGRGSSSSSAATAAAAKAKLLEHAESLTSGAFVPVRNRDRAELAREAAGLIGTSELKALSTSKAMEGLTQSFYFAELAPGQGVDELLRAQGDSSRSITLERLAKIERDTGATRRQIDAFLAFRHALPIK